MDFGHFLKKFSLVSHQYCFTCSWQELSAVCGIWASEAQFWCYFGPQNKSKFMSLAIFSNSFTKVLLHMLIGSTFICVENMGLRGPILGPLQVFDHFLKNFPLVSHQSWFTCQFELLLGVLISASEAPCPGHFGPQNRT